MFNRDICITEIKSTVSVYMRLICIVGTIERVVFYVNKFKKNIP